MGASELPISHQIEEFYDDPVSVSHEVKPLLFLQSLQGRLRNGSKSETLGGNPFEDITFDETCRFAGYDPHEIRSRRQSMVFALKEFYATTLVSGGQFQCEDLDGKALYGLEFLQNHHVTDKTGFFKGAALAAYMDSGYWRDQTIQNYPFALDGKPFHLGTGEEYVVDMQRIRELGVKVSELEDSEHDAGSIERLVQQRVITNNPFAQEATNQYIRHTGGPGICDDAAMIAIGRIHGLDAMVGALLMDATDTYGKGVLYASHGGVDQGHADYIMDHWKNITGNDLVSPEEIMQIIYLGAKKNGKRLGFSSSHKRLAQHELSVHKRGYASKQPTILRHVNHLVGEYEPIHTRYGYHRFNSTKFYNLIDARFEQYEQQFGKLPSISGLRESIKNSTFYDSE